jgi:transcriptional regulator with XRE-family HTH domain
VTAVSEKQKGVTVPLRKRRRLLHAFREQYGLTLTELGELTGLSFSMLSKFERGGRDLSSEAWIRVLAGIQKVLSEDDARRKQEREIAAETATKLGVPTFFSTDILAFPGWVPFEDDEEITKQKAVLEADSLRLSALGKINSRIGCELTALDVQQIAAEEKRLREDPAALRKFIRDFVDLAASVEKRHQEIAALDAKGYVILPKAVEEERDQLKAEVAALKQDLERERTKNGGAANA